MKSIRTIQRALKMYRWLDSYKQQKGYSPTIREAAEWLEITFEGGYSTSVAKWYFDLMRSWGWIDWVNRSARTIRLLKTDSQVDADVRLMKNLPPIETNEVQAVYEGGQPVAISVALPVVTADVIVSMIRTMNKKPVSFSDAQRIAYAMVNNTSLRAALVVALAETEAGEPA